MGNIFKVLRRDFLRLFKVPAAWVILFGMVFIPPLYSWYNIVGFWDPYGNTKGITVAIANNDDGTDNALIGKQNPARHTQPSSFPKTFPTISPAW